MKRPSFKQYLPGIAWFFLLVILLAIPGSEFPETDDWLKEIYFDKWVHTGLFGMLAYLFMHPFLPAKKATFTRIALLIVVLTSAWGLTTEFLQEALVNGRSFDLWDWAADTLGAIIAALFARGRQKRFSQRIN